VIFSDEKKFNLDGPDGFNGYWRDLRKEPKYFSKRNFGGGSVMVWGAFSSFGKLDLQFISTKMDGREYQEVLSHSLLPYIHKHHPQKLFYQQDNAGIHISKNRRRSDPEFVPMMEWFQSQGVELLEWPGISPDLNPMENIWGIMVQRIFSDGKQYDTEAQLKQAIQKAWNEIEPELIQKLVDSMKDRIFQVIQRSGHATDY